VNVCVCQGVGKEREREICWRERESTRVCVRGKWKGERTRDRVERERERACVRERILCVCVHICTPHTLPVEIRERETECLRRGGGAIGYVCFESVCMQMGALGMTRCVLFKRALYVFAKELCVSAEEPCYRESQVEILHGQIPTQCT